jgi:hypothetical protein
MPRKENHRELAVQRAVVQKAESLHLKTALFAGNSTRLCLVNAIVPDLTKWIESNPIS